MKKRTEIPLKITAALAMLSALSIILGKYLAIPGGEVLRFSFENLPIIFAGVAFGPLAGALVGAVADLIGCLLVGYTINPLVTTGAICIGAISGVTYALLKRTSLPYALKIALSVALAHLIGSVLIKTVGLSQWYDMPLLILMLWRLLNYVIVGALEGILLFILLKNKLISGEILSLMGTKKHTVQNNSTTSSTDTDKSGDEK